MGPRAIVRSLAVIGLIGAGLVPATNVGASSTVPVFATGKVGWTATSQRYFLPSVGPFKFIGTFVRGNSSYHGPVDGSVGTLDTSTITYPVTLWAPEGSLTGTCSGTDTGLELNPELTLSCVVSVLNTPATPVVFVLDGVATQTSGDSTYGPQTTRMAGVFTTQ